jgi:outer membrane protein OmpA-like peptidoglycan-associated protein
MIRGVGHRQQHRDDDENYFVSMTDMMVGMLVIFIIVLMAFALNYKSAQDQREVQLVDVESAIKTIAHEIDEIRQLDSQRANLLRELQRRLKARGIPVEIDDVNGVLHLPDKVLFDFGVAELSPSGKVAVASLAEALLQVLPCYSGDGGRPRPMHCSSSFDVSLESVFIEGHTDNIGSESHNLALSSSRAINTYLELERAAPALGSINNDKNQRLLSVTGYAFYRPIAPNDTMENRRQNRRIDLRFIMSVSHDRALLRIKQQLEKVLSRDAP